MNLLNPPEKFWHCMVTVNGNKRPHVVNDLTFDQLQRSVITPWHAGSAFTIQGAIIRSPESVSEIRIANTAHDIRTYIDIHEASMRAKGIADMATIRSTLAFHNGNDYTFPLLFEGKKQKLSIEPDAATVELLCRRLPQAARILGSRSRKGKTSYSITDEYDVQDLLHAVLRAYLKFSVQEDPLPKVAGAKSSRTDISIEDLGILIEVKYVHGPSDQKRLFDEYSQDLVLYAKWPHLKTLIYLIYNSADLPDAEAFEKLAGSQEISGVRFNVLMVLA